MNFFCLFLFLFKISSVKKKLLHIFLHLMLFSDSCVAGASRVTGERESGLERERETQKEKALGVEKNSCRFFLLFFHRGHRPFLSSLYFLFVSFLPGPLLLLLLLDIAVAPVVVPPLCVPRLSPRRAARYRASEEERLELLLLSSSPVSLLPPFPPPPPTPFFFPLFFFSLACLASSSSTASLDLLAAASTAASTLPADLLRSDASSSPPGWSRDDAAIASEPRATEPRVAARAKPAVWLLC